MPVSEGYHSLCFQTFNFLPNVWWVCVLRCRVVKGHVSFCFWIVCLCPLSVFLWGTWSFAYLFLKALYILESLALCNEWQIFFPHVVGLHFDRFFFFLFPDIRKLTLNQNYYEWISAEKKKSRYNKSHIPK